MVLTHRSNTHHGKQGEQRSLAQAHARPPQPTQEQLAATVSQASTLLPWLHCHSWCSRDIQAMIEYALHAQQVSQECMALRKPTPPPTNHIACRPRSRQVFVALMRACINLVTFRQTPQTEVTIHPARRCVHQHI